MKNKSIWSLAILVIIVSLLSILVIKNQALAVWSNPSANPPSTISDTKFVFNPVTANLDLNNKNLNSGAKASFTEVCINNDCKIAWPDFSSDTGSLDWKINSSLGIGNEALYYTTTTGSGNVGIGKNDPTTKLHLYNDSSGPLISLSGYDSNYRGIKITDTANTEKWFYGSNASNNFVIRRNNVSDALMIANSSGNVSIGGNVAIGYNLVPSYPKLYIYDNTWSYPIKPVLKAENGKDGGIAIGAYAKGHDSTSNYFSKGVDATGEYAVYGKTNYNNGAGIYGEDNLSYSNTFAAKFKGSVLIFDGNYSKGFLQINSKTTAPLASDCSATYIGRMIYEQTTDTLYICGSTGWRKIATTL